MSESTAKTHITHIYQKLGAANRAQALVTAMRLGPARPPVAAALLSAVARDGAGPGGPAGWIRN